MSGFWIFDFGLSDGSARRADAKNGAPRINARLFRPYSRTSDNFKLAIAASFTLGVSPRTVNSFLAHVGERNAIDLDYTLAQRRSVSEVAHKLPRGPERSYFESTELRDAFPTGEFNVWGVPKGARTPFDHTRRGDVVFFAPNVSREGGCLLYAGIVKLVPRLDFPTASRILWPASGSDVYPNLFFLEAERGMISWFEFMCDICYAHDWNPKGWYVRLDRPAYRGTHDPLAYLDHLRATHGFRKLDAN